MHAQAEAAAAGLLDAQARVAFDQPARQQDQPRLEVVAQVRQADVGRASQLAVAELGAPVLLVVAQQLP